ncbi:heterotrimeric G protein alpha subunit 4 [Stereum hirsutum FP-91666 SS1]|uniref:heterotrimeric G protein alpha subunit 4 n=1 Tax=Stereum hirsutum (strain FP-91666) TaxID=721885 RepID=UPI000440B627|nr:heterotrimeric G protein alpha subunit 4 [Stereum hirsutum FP-91666 SS1]EIM92063.1 heterotrimeric G protein alpha subunit 4 [Stereum hirsutum FP-91666 SS1]
MGICTSSGGIEISEDDKQRHREAEKVLKEAKTKLAVQVKVLLLGSGDSGKSTILKQMRLIHKIPFTSNEVESYRQLVFNNLTHGLKYLLDAMEDMGLEVTPENVDYVDMIENAADIRDGEPFPTSFMGPLQSLWSDPMVQKAWERGNEAALPENLSYFYSDLERLFSIDYIPTEQDIVRCRARTIGITETVFQLRDHEMLMVDVGGQKSERRKWIHCFQDVTSILFLVSLSGYDQCLVEDKDANQMQDAMTIWDSICHSQWFKATSIILFLNKNDLFEAKVEHSDIKNFFPDYEGPPANAREGREYFKKRFARLAQKAGRSKEREIYIHITTATDTALLRVVMAAVEANRAQSFVSSYVPPHYFSIVLRNNLEVAALI